MLSKEELEKLKIGNILKCYDLEDNFLYDLEVVKVKWGRNGIRYTFNINSDLNPKLLISRFTINGSFKNDGTHNPGPDKLKRYYTF